MPLALCQLTATERKIHRVVLREYVKFLLTSQSISLTSPFNKQSNTSLSLCLTCRHCSSFLSILPMFRQKMNDRIISTISIYSHQCSKENFGIHNFMEAEELCVLLDHKYVLALLTGLIYRAHCIMLASALTQLGHLCSGGVGARCAPLWNPACTPPAAAEGFLLLSRSLPPRISPSRSFRTGPRPDLSREPAPDAGFENPLWITIGDGGAIGV